MRILDSDELPQSNSLFFNRKVVEFIPLMIIILSFLYGSFKKITTEFTFPTLSIIGFSIAGLLIVLFFLHRKSYKVLLGLLLIAGTLNLVGFNIRVVSLQLSFGMLTFSVQYFSLGLLILYIIIFRHGVNKFLDILRDLFREKELTKEESEEEKLRSIKFYKRNLSDKTTESLRLISEDGSRVLEARIAAEEIISERETNQD